MPVIIQVQLAESMWKQIIRHFIKGFVAFMSKTRPGKFLLREMVGAAMSETTIVKHDGLDIRFSTPSVLTRYRAATFATKEPETIEWINGFAESSTFWDIGANVGIYSCFAGMSRKCHTFAFEPSVFNLEILARNIALNNLGDLVSIVPFALSDRNGINKMKLTSTEWGGALSAFGADFGQDGKEIDVEFFYRTVGMSVDSLVQSLSLKAPRYMKIDVDGIEHLILSDARKTLSGVESVLIEINDDFHEQESRSRELLGGSGFSLLEKRQSQKLSQSVLSQSFNQIWVR